MDSVCTQKSLKRVAAPWIYSIRISHEMRKILELWLFLMKLKAQVYGASSHLLCCEIKIQLLNYSELDSLFLIQSHLGYRSSRWNFWWACSQGDPSHYLRGLRVVRWMFFCSSLFWLDVYCVYLYIYVLLLFFKSGQTRGYYNVIFDFVRSTILWVKILLRAERQTLFSKRRRIIVPAGEMCKGDLERAIIDTVVFPLKGLARFMWINFAEVKSVFERFLPVARISSWMKVRSHSTLSIGCRWKD